MRVYLPPDANCTLQTIDHCLRSTNYINLVIASKQPMPQWLAPDEAYDHCKTGASIWRWASSDAGDAPDVVLAAAGDNVTMELMAAVWLLRREAPELRRARRQRYRPDGAGHRRTSIPHGLTEDSVRGAVHC